MNYEQAHRILDQHKEGQHYNEYTITKALQLTGDLSGHAEGFGQETRKTRNRLQGKCSIQFRKSKFEKRTGFWI